MPAARFWRAIGLQSVGGGALELSALHLYLGGARVDATATLTSTIAPTAGTLANLQDDDTATVCRFADVTAPGFVLVWDFGSGNTQDVGAVRLGSGALQNEFLEGVTLQYSSTGAAWESIIPVVAQWPGVNAMQSVPTAGDTNFDKVSLLLHMDGADNSTVFTDSSFAAAVVTAAGNAKISTAQSKFGGSSGLFSGPSLTGLTFTPISFGASDNFTIEGWMLPLNTATFAFLCGFGDTSPNTQICRVQNSDGSVISALSPSDILSASGVAINEWGHFALSRSNGTLYFFYNGLLKASKASSTAFSVNSVGFAYAIYGAEYIDELRITKGVARYTANFTPSTEAFPDTGGGGARINPRLRPSVAPTVILPSGGPSAPAGPVLSPQPLRLDLQDFGLYRIYGTVELNGTPNTPLYRRVELWNQRDKRLIRETWSDATTGAWSFDYIRGGDGTRYSVVTYDHTGQHRAEIADNLTAEAM